MPQDPEPVASALDELDAAATARPGTGRLAFLVGVLAVYAALLITELPGSAWELRQVTPATSAGGDRPAWFSMGFLPEMDARYLHSPTAVELPDGRMLAAWYAGSEEGARDVAIHTAEWNPVTGAWSPPRAAVTPDLMAERLNRHIRKVGNPVLARLPDGRTGLFVVSTSIGGWATSALNLAVSDDGGRTWPEVRRLRTTPWFNLSTLVRNRPQQYASGDLLLPAYQEFMGKFAEVIRLDAALEVTGKRRLSWGRSTLQPAVVPGSPHHDGVAFLRSTDRAVYNVIRVERRPDGAGWSEPAALSLPNPNTSIAAMRLRDGGVLLAFNDDPEDRIKLTLAHSADNGQTWKRLKVIETGPRKPRHAYKFAYPWLMRGSDETLHLFYSWNNLRIRHVTFNEQWLREQL